MKSSVALIFVLIAVTQATSVENVERYCSVLSQDNCESLFNICQWNKNEGVCDAAVMRNLGASDKITSVVAEEVVKGLTPDELSAALLLAAVADGSALAVKLATMTEAEGEAFFFQVFLQLLAAYTSSEIETVFAALDSSDQDILLAELSLTSDASAAQVAVAVKAKISAADAYSTPSPILVMSDPDSDNMELFTLSVSMADVIVSSLDANDFTNAKTVTGTTDSATLKAALVAMTAAELQVVREKVMYLEFNAMTSGEQFFFIASLTTDELTKLKAKLGVAASAKLSEVTIAFSNKASTEAVAILSPAGEIDSTLKSTIDATSSNPDTLIQPDNKVDDRKKLFVDATGMVTKELTANLIAVTDPDELARLKNFYGVTDSAILIEKITFQSEIVIGDLVDQMMYVKFNSMTPSEQLFAIEELSAADLTILKAKFGLSSSATTAQVSARLNTEATNFVTDNPYYLHQPDNSDFNPKKLLVNEQLKIKGPLEKITLKIYSRKQVAFTIYLMDVDSYIIAKEITGTSDSAALETALFARTIAEYFGIIQQVCDLTTDKQEAIIQELSPEDLKKLKEQLGLSESATITDVIAEISIKAKERKIYQNKRSDQTDVSTSNGYVTLLSLLLMLMCDL